MELIHFIQEVSRQNILPRNSVEITTNGNIISGTLVPFDLIIHGNGEMLSKVIHERNNELLVVVKAMPDGFGPDVGTSVLISEIKTITKIN